MSMTDFLKSLLSPAPTKMGIGHFYSGIDRGDARLGIMGDAPEQQLSEIRNSIADQTAEIRAMASQSSDVETRTRME